MVSTLRLKNLKCSFRLLVSATPNSVDILTCGLVVSLIASLYFSDAWL